MLSAAVIGDSQIVVKSADDTDTSGESDSEDAYSPNTKERTKGDLLAEILAHGYVLQETIVETGCELNGTLYCKLRNSFLSY